MKEDYLFRTQKELFGDYIMTNPISSAAQSILDMVNAAPHCGSGRIKAAAALRAAADHLTDATSSHTLYAIADELEGITYGTYRCNLESQ